jgi:RNA polymerase subunit RPABC4/transcription elongation factor Spt4
MKACKECKKEISTEAKICPNCGKKNPTSSFSVLKWIGVALVGFFVLGIIIEANKSPEQKAADAVARAEREAKRAEEKAKVDPKTEALNSVKLEKLNWYKGGFGSTMMLDATIKNDGSRDVKDIKIECTHYSNSGTRIDSNKSIVFELVKAKKSFLLKEFNMGFIHSQASSTSCQITDLVLL